ncbi:MAG: glycoside hydrolase family 3 C-terminal domain-containing protein [Clostridia bacterium]|nr:glycoside hydrolase family 3 C-terminal domain-containing protein [Clostridia bacterium]
MKDVVKNRLFKRSMWTLLSIFFALIMIIFIIITPIAMKSYIFVDQFFGAVRTVPVNVDTDNPNDFQYYQSEFSKKDENGDFVLETKYGVNNQVLDTEAMYAYSDRITEQVNTEGSVLLWNNIAKDGKPALPLSKGDKISNFGMGTVNWVHHGVGSGRVNVDDTSIFDVQKVFAAESVGLKLNEECLKSLENGYRKSYGISFRQTNEMSWSAYSAAAKNRVTQFGDAGVYIVSRYYGEAGGISTVAAPSDDGDYLSLTDAERGVIDGLISLKDQNKLKKIIVVINSAAQINLKNIDMQKVDACLWVGWGGSTGMKALADMLVGNASPSGHLTDTWAFDNKSAPSNKNFGIYKYSSLPNGIVKDTDDKYLVYQEGIYVGYRYYETRYEDTVLGKGNASSGVGGLMNTAKWSYVDEVAFPFGHGESYTKFEYGDFAVEKNGSDYNVSVKVTNTGERAGKDAVQVYLQKPYTQYDKDNGIEKAAVELAGFIKTPEIAPGKSATVTITVPEYEFKCYDGYGKGTYILEKGDYFLAAGKDSHDALNNILAAKNKTVADGMDHDGNAALAYRVNYASDDFDTYSKTANGTKIVNRFADADVNLNKGMDQKVVYLSRDDWQGTYPSGAVLALKGDENRANILYEVDAENDPADEMPIYNTVTSEYGELKLVQLMGLDYDNALWKDLLNQMTFDEQAKLIQSSGISAVTRSISAPGISQRDGSCGVRDGGYALPSNTIVGATYNTELAKTLGNVFGTHLLNASIAGVYGPAVNIHRSHWGARAYEYYGEDGFLSGEMCAAEIKGLREMGAVVFVKHLILNEQEDFRSGMQTWANEQSIREIYLKAYEKFITDGSCNGVMTSYNRIGTVWTGQHDGLLNGVLRGEWGFNGVAITDANAGTDKNFGRAVAAGQDAWLGGMPEDALDRYYKDNNGTVCQAVRESAHRILYTQLHSFMMNGVSTSTRFMDVMPGWEKALLAVKIVSGVLMGLCLAMVAASWIIWYSDKKNKTNLKED